MTVTTAAGTVKRMSGVGSKSGSALPGALMFLAGGALVFWALSGWGLFGLKKASEAVTKSAANEVK